MDASSPQRVARVGLIEMQEMEPGETDLTHSPGEVKSFHPSEYHAQTVATDVYFPFKILSGMNRKKVDDSPSF